jgi:hypothetical protein
VGDERNLFSFAYRGSFVHVCSFRFLGSANGELAYNGFRHRILCECCFFLEAGCVDV